GGADNAANRTRIPIKAQVAYFRPRASSAAATSPPTSASTSSFGALYGPRRGSTILSVISPQTTASMMTEATPNHQLAVMDTLRLGFMRWMASLVMPWRMPSRGFTRRLTPNTEATPAKDAASPTNGLRPTLKEAAAPNGIRTR